LFVSLRPLAATLHALKALSLIGPHNPLIN
jgi:hypothetical protein